MPFTAIIQDPAAFGGAIRHARWEKGLSQLALAGIAGCSQRFISELERGKATAELGKALQVMQALGLSMQLGTADPAGNGRAEVENAVSRIESGLRRPGTAGASLADFLGGAR